MLACRLVITGRVQGVGYREAMVAAARRAGVAGWVRNRADGTVEALLQGDAALVDAMIAWSRRGPPAARVIAVEVEPAATDPHLADFAHRMTR